MAGSAVTGSAAMLDELFRLRDSKVKLMHDYLIHLTHICMRFEISVDSHRNFAPKFTENPENVYEKSDGVLENLKWKESAQHWLVDIREILPSAMKTSIWLFSNSTLSSSTSLESSTRIGKKFLNRKICLLPFRFISSLQLQSLIGAPQQH